VATQDQDRDLALEQENALLRSRLQACEQSYAILQAEGGHHQSGQPPSASITEQRLWEATTATTNALLTITNFDEAVNTALQILGEALDTDRVNIIENFDLPHDSAFPGWRSLGYEWNSPETAPQYTDTEAAQGTYEEIPEIFEQLHQGQAISYLIEDAPEPFRSAQRAIGVKSTHLVPIFVEGQWWGVLGIDDCREAKRRTPAELAVLKIAANCIGSAIQRQRTQQALLKAEQERASELERANNVLQGTVAALADRRELEGFIGEILHTIAREFESPLVEYWQILGTDTVEVNTWLCQGELLSLKQGHEHPSRGGIRLLPEYIHSEDFTHRSKVFVFNQPMPAYSLASGRVICPTEWYAERGAFGHFNFPLQAGDTTLGSISVWLSGNRQIPEDYLRLGQTLSHQTAFAIQLTQLAEEAKHAAVAREQEKAAQERAAELAKANEALARTSQRLVEQPDLSAFLSHVALEAIAQLNADSAMISVLDEQHQVLRAVAHVEQGRIASGLGAEMPINEAEFVNLLLQTHKPRYFNLEQEAHLFWPGAIAYHQQRHHQAIMAVPLFAGEQFLGHLGLAFTHTNPIKNQDSELLFALAQQAALAIQLTRLAEEAKHAAVAREQEKATQERAAELEKINTALSHTLYQLVDERSIERFLEQLLVVLSETINSAHAMLFTIDAQTETACAIVAVRNGIAYNNECSEDPYPKVACEPANISIVLEYFRRTRDFWILNTTEAQETVISDVIVWHRRNGHRQAIAAPLFVGETLIGLLGFAFTQKASLSPFELEFIKSLASQAAIAIHLTKLAEEAKQAAVAREQEKAAQERMTQLAKANTTLKKTLDVLATEPLIDRSLGHVLQVLTEQLESFSSALWLYNPDTQRFSLHLVYLNGDIIPAIPENMDRLIGQWTRDRELPCDLKFKQHIRDRKPVIYEVTNFPELSQQFMQRLEVKTLLGIPLLLGSEIIGSFTVRFSETRQFQVEELELTQALAHQATLALRLTQLSALAQHEAQQAAILDERNRMARELHDTLAQTFTGIIMQLEAIQTMITITTVEPAQKHLHQAGLLARQGLQEARRSVWSLRNEVLESDDLPTALLRLAQQMTDHTTIQTDVIVDGTAIALPAKLENHLLRIGQEALTNALKHAHPQRIQIGLQFAADTVQLQIVDDGRGFDPQQQWRGFGITCMQERTHQIGGEFSLKSQMGQGTTVHVTIPLSPSEASAS